MLQDNLKEVFFRHLEAPSAEKVIKIVEDFTEAETNVRVGYGDVGLEDLVSALKCQRISSAKEFRLFMFFQVINLSSEDLILVEKSASLLCNELKIPVKIVAALELGILDTLTELLNDFKYFVSPTLIPKLLLMLQILSSDFHASMRIARDEGLMKAILSLTGSEVDRNFSKAASEVVLSLCLTPSG